MKTVFVTDILEHGASNSEFVLLGWIRDKHDKGGVVFLTISDSSGSLQAVGDRRLIGNESFDALKRTPIESAVRIVGKLVDDSRAKGGRELQITEFQVIGAASRSLSPSPRGEIDIFDPRLTDQLLQNRHFYLRNPKVMAVLKFRHLLMGAVHEWFRENGFIEITAPVLTPLPLYDDRTAIPVTVHDEQVFLTQCVGFYLEAAVHAFERVYNIGPSFRGEESRSKRHLMEYWHIKAELAFGNLEDIIGLTEGVIQYVIQRLEKEGKELAQIIGTEYCTDGLVLPYPRISYREAVSLIQKTDPTFQFGSGLSSKEEELLSVRFTTPFWVVGIPRSIEPFPYVINPDDVELTQTADLIATRGFGELLGVAEKINDYSMLRERMEEKGKLDREEYRWLLELREMGCVPHIGFGLGVERFIRWLLQIEHVRDAIPFPRIFRRNIYP